MGNGKNRSTIQVHVEQLEGLQSGRPRSGHRTADIALSSTRQGGSLVLSAVGDTARLETLLRGCVPGEGRMGRHQPSLQKPNKTSIRLLIKIFNHFHLNSGATAWEGGIKGTFVLKPYVIILFVLRENGMNNFFGVGF